MNIRAFLSLLFLGLSVTCCAQNKKLDFAVITDIHIGRGNAPEEIAKSVESINKNPDIQFVLVTGDLTNLGTDTQIGEVKAALDKLNKKYYAIPGNHEEVWSESGGTAFKKVFGMDRFAFEHSGYFFIGTDCGPVLRHGLAHVPKDNLIWMDSVFSSRKDKNMPVIFANHYPMDRAVDNHYEVIKRLRKVNIQLMLCGHGHANRQLNFDGLPAIMCRCNLLRDNSVGYNLVSINDGKISFTEIDPYQRSTHAAWVKFPLAPVPKEEVLIHEPDYSVNSRYPNIQDAWTYEHNDDISGGFAIDEKYLYSGTFDGKLIALNRTTGKIGWFYTAGGRVFSTPALTKDKIVFTSTNGNVYCISKSGKLLWKFTSKKPIVSSPVIKGNQVFTGFSDQSFRCLNLNDGSVVWDFDQLKSGFVMHAALDDNAVYFGAWNSSVYALDQKTGKLKWEWSNKLSPIFSPAMIAPIVVNERVFTLTPDNKVTCFEAETGKILWREKNPEIPVWFSGGVSQDNQVIFAKTRNDKAVGISATATNMQVIFNTPIPIHNDSSPTPIPEKDGSVFFCSVNGSLIVVSKDTGKLLWEHKMGNSSINMILPVSKDEVYVSSNDGKITLLKASQD